MDNLYLIATIAGQPVAIRASAVHSVVDVDQIAPVPLAPGHVAGLATLRSRVLTVICCECAIGLEPRPTQRKRAVVVEAEGHHYALLVGTIDDVRVFSEPPAPVRARLEGGWTAIADGLLDDGGQTILLVDHEAIIASSEAMAA